MQTNNPSVTLDNFGLIGDNSNLYLTENMLTKKVKGKRVLCPSIYSTKLYNEHTATITNNLAGNAFSAPLAMEALNSGNDRFHYVMDETMNIWCIKSPYGNVGQKIYAGNEVCTYPDIKATGTGETDKILFTKPATVGAIHRGRATGGGVTSLEDTARDFTAGEFKLENGHGALAADDVVYNLKTNKLYKISAGGIAANTLTLTALDGGSGFSDDDYYCIVNPDWATLDENAYAYGRQIIEHRGYQFILNGDNISMYDGTTFSADYKLIETNWIGRTICSAGSILAVGANNNYKGKVYFWSLGLDGWKNIISFDSEILSIVPYGESFIVLSGNGLWLTDGYTKSKLDTFPDFNIRGKVLVQPNGAVVVDKYVVINSSYGGLRRDRQGIYIYNLEDRDFAFARFEVDTNVNAYYSSYGKLVFYDGMNGTVLYSVANAAGTSNCVMNNLYLDSPKNNAAFITAPIKLGASISKIEVNIEKNFMSYDNFVGSFNLECKIADCNRQLWAYAQVYENATKLDEIKIKLTSGHGTPTAGDEILFRDKLNAYLRRQILSVTTTVVGADTFYNIVLDEALPNLELKDNNITISPFRRCGMEKRTFSNTDDLGIIDFTPDFSGDNCMLEFIITETGSSQPIIIESITISV